MQRSTHVFPLLLVLCVISLAGTGCDRFPQDPHHTLEQVLQRDTLHVGVVGSSPWVTGQEPGDPGGVEAMLLSDFANELGVHIAWQWGGAEAHFEALAQYDLDVVIGGFTHANPWHTHVGFSFPYYTSHTVVGVPPSATRLGDLAGTTVAVRPHSGLREALEERGATVVVREDLATVAGPVAAEDWEIEAMGFRSADIPLRKHLHVMAVPQGENAMLMRLEDFLLRRADEARVSRLLEEAASL